MISTYRASWNLKNKPEWKWASKSCYITSSCSTEIASGWNNRFHYEFTQFWKCNLESVSFQEFGVFLGGECLVGWVGFCLVVFFCVEDFSSPECFEQVGVSALLLFGHKLITVVSNHHSPYQFHYSEGRMRALLLLFFRKNLTWF